jgi:hypothetical protein
VHELEWSDFAGSDGSDVDAIAIVASIPTPRFELLVDRLALW